MKNAPANRRASSCIGSDKRGLEKLMREALPTAKPGDIFTPEARPVIKRLLASVFAGPDGKQLKASIMDENQATPAEAKPTVNGRYPDTVPLTTIPPQVLQTLPKLTEDLEYRFIGDSLILLDVHAHVIADFIEDVLDREQRQRMVQLAIGVWFAFFWSGGDPVDPPEGPPNGP